MKHVKATPHNLRPDESVWFRDLLIRVARRSSPQLVAFSLVLG